MFVDSYSRCLFRSHLPLFVIYHQRVYPFSARSYIDPDPDLMTSNTLSSTNASLDPFDWLPNELLAHIFFYVVESPLHYSQTEILDWRNHNWVDVPRLPCAVCRRWRSIALSTPRLWENVSVDFRRQLEGGYANYLKQWLERCGQNSISLKIGPIYEFIERDSCSPPRMALQNFVNDVTGIVSSVLHRCKAIYIGQCKGVLDLQKIQDHFVNDMPSLRELYIDTAFHGDMDLRSSSRLEAFTDVDGRNPFSRYRFGETQFHTLRRLESYGSTSDLYYILVHFSSLIECTFDVSHAATPSIDVTLATRTFVRPVLENLKVSANSEHDLLGFYCLWKQFRLPSLKKLLIDLEEPVEVEDRDWASFHSFFQQSRPPLEVLELTFQNVAMPDVHLSGILSCLPNLKRLSIDYYDTPESGAIMLSFWQHLRESERPIDDSQPEGSLAVDRCRNFAPFRPQICPRLEFLRVCMGAPVMRHRLDDVAGFILSQCSPSDDGFRSSTSPSSGNNSPILREVFIYCCDFTEDGFLQYPGIDKCLNNGFNVSLEEGALKLLYSADCEFSNRCI